MNTSAQFDLITIGDSTIDTFIKIHDATVQCDINHKDCKICIGYGDKIPVDSIAHGVAGNAANVAVGASSLGLKTAIYTNLGDDDHGKTIREALVRANVATDFIKIHPKSDSNLSVVLSFRKERTIFVYHQDWHYKLPPLTTCSWIYLTSMAESFIKSKVMNEIVNYIKRTRTKLSFGPGTYQLKHDIRRYPNLLEVCELLIVNMCEAKTILKIDQTELVDPADLLSKLLLLGPKIAVITDGELGSYSSNGQKNLRMGVIPSRVVEKTGAGDAYSSAFLTALSKDLSLEEAMIWGTLNSSSVIGQVGAQNGQMTEEEIIKMRKKFFKLKPAAF